MPVMKDLRDWLGRKIAPKELTEEVADARVSVGRDPFSVIRLMGSAAEALAILRAAANGDPLAYFELAEDIEERDLHYAAVLATRSARSPSCRSPSCRLRQSRPCQARRTGAGMD